MKIFHAIFYTSFVWLLAVLIANCNGHHITLPFCPVDEQDIDVASTAPMPLPVPHSQQEASAFDALNIGHKKWKGR